MAPASAHIQKTVTAKKSQALLYGIGNPGRRDDGLGITVASHFEHDRISSLDVEQNYQLNAEDALTIANRELVIFADASLTAGEPFSFTPVTPAYSIDFSTHSMSPESVLSLCRNLFSCSPRCFVMAIRGYEWDMVEGLSEKAQNNCSAAIEFLKSFLKDTAF